MRHVKYLRDGTRKVYDGQIECPLVVLGQRDGNYFRPQFPGPNASDEAKLAYRKANADHQRALVAGQFSETTLEWCEDEIEAAAMVAKFHAPEWINVRVEPVSDILLRRPKQ